MPFDERDLERLGEVVRYQASSQSGDLGDLSRREQRRRRRQLAAGGVLSVLVVGLMVAVASTRPSATDTVTYGVVGGSTLDTAARVASSTPTPSSPSPSSTPPGCGAAGSTSTSSVQPRSTGNYTVEFEPIPKLYQSYDEPRCHEVARITDEAGADVADITIHRRGGRVPENLLERDAKLVGVSVYEHPEHGPDIVVNGNMVPVHTFGSSATPQGTPIIYVVSLELPRSTIVLHGMQMEPMTRFLQMADVSTLLGL